MAKIGTLLPRWPRGSKPLTGSGPGALRSANTSLSISLLYGLELAFWSLAPGLDSWPSASCSAVQNLLATRCSTSRLRCSRSVASDLPASRWRASRLRASSPRTGPRRSRVRSIASCQCRPSTSSATSDMHRSCTGRSTR